uniref:Uncharacterized protein n=1 Tax=Oryza barthii TaxID=65489 RepID=A0A0D3GRQ4_9ORYZ
MLASSPSSPPLVASAGRLFAQEILQFVYVIIDKNQILHQVCQNTTNLVLLTCFYPLGLEVIQKVFCVRSNSLDHLQPVSEGTIDDEPALRDINRCSDMKKGTLHV